MKYCLGLFLIFPLIGCATERLIVRVTDQDDNPVSNAIVTVETRKDIICRNFWTDLKSEMKEISAPTDTNGVAVVKFSCPCAYFDWWVKKNGYYNTNDRSMRFAEKEVTLAECMLLGKVPLLEHEKRDEIKIYKKKNPIPMYAYGKKIAARTKTPYKNGKYGFDLKLFDWLPPYGKGEVADFYYVRDRRDIENINKFISAGKIKNIFKVDKKTPELIPPEGTLVGRIEFDDGCGAYVEKMRDKMEYSSVYCADTNAIYKTTFPIIIEELKSLFGHYYGDGDIVKYPEYMIIRSRVKKNDKGEIISAHYSKLYGSWGFEEGMRLWQVVFNPNENDINLEFDTEKQINESDYYERWRP